MKQTEELININQVAEIELIYKSKVKPSERPKIQSSKGAVDVFRSHWDSNRIELFEEIKVLYLNTNCSVLGIYSLCKGGIRGTICDTRLILAGALKVGAVGIIIAHNHPGGSLIPSQQDKDVTRKMVEACAYMDIKLYDHVILTAEEHFSFADEGLI